MKLKKWLIISHLIIMIAPVFTGIVLFKVINNYNNKSSLKDYLLAINKFKVYEQKVDNPQLYNERIFIDKNIVPDEEKNIVSIELYNAAGKLIYCSANNSFFYTQVEDIYSNLYKVETGYKAYTLKKPVFKDKVVVGIYKITLARGEFVEQVNNRTMAAIVCFIVVLVIVFFIVVLLLNRKFNKPIKLLIDGMDRFARGDESVVENKYNDEIGELINQFNIMKKDIEDKRRTIEDEQKSKEYMISAISHDLKTPLTSIRAYAEALVCDNSTDTTRVREKAVVILNKSDYMNKLLEDLITYNFLSSDYKLKFVEVEGTELFDMLFSGYEESCQKKSIILRTDIDIQGEYFVDVTQMTRVIDNLTANAIKYTCEGGQVWLGAYSANKEFPNWVEEGIKEKLRGWRETGCLLLIKNQGEPIPFEEQEKIFRPFYQIDNSRNKKGSGLGLSIVSLVLQKHKGEVKVFSENDSTIFVCWIPSIKNK